MRLSFFGRAISGLTALTLFGSQMVCPTPTEAAPGSATASAGSVPPPGVSAVQSFQPDLFTGRATTSIPIVVPPGRKQLQPNLALTYSSSDRNAWLGVGWGLDLGYIERSTKLGVPHYDAGDTFAFLFQDVGSELVQIPDGTYRAKDEGLFLRFRNNGVSGWEVTDKSGTRYYFGRTTASQIAQGGRTFRWTLDKALDVHGNTILITYAKDQGQIYLDRIQYTGHEPTGLAPANHVEFQLEDRPDIETSYRSGFPVTTAKRLKIVEMRATVNGVLSLARRYALTYQQSPQTDRSLLTGVTQIGMDGVTSLPQTMFAYTDKSPTYFRCHSCVPGLTPSSNSWQLQYHIGNLFPRDEGGNNQTLWPSGKWDPGVKTWNEKICRGRSFFKSCHEEQRTAAIPAVPWSGPELARSGSANGVNWSTDASGNLTVNGPPDTHLLAITWLYTPSTKTVSTSGLSTSGQTSVFYIAAGGSAWTPAVGGQIPLSSGWTVVAVTAYDEIGGFNLSMSANLASQVTAMHRNQFSPMRLSGDFNGDGYMDLAHVDPTTHYWRVVLNSLSSFVQEQTWLSTILPAELVPMVGDTNADGKADLVLWNPTSGAWQVSRSTGSAFQSPENWHNGFGAGQTPLMGDFNGDQLLDAGSFSNGAWTVALSNGSQFTSPTTWLTGFGVGAAPLTGDFNGDGLTDIAAALNGNVNVALSDGTSLLEQPTAWVTGFGFGQNLTSADLNGDGLTDVLYYDKASGTIAAAFSTGHGFGPSQAFLADHPFTLKSNDDILQIGDFRGNGLNGFGVFNAVSGESQIAFALGTSPDLLISIENGLGGRTTLTYQPSTQLKNSSLPFILPMISQVDTADGMEHVYTTRYRYEGGLYDTHSKDFLGFRQAIISDAADTSTQTTFSQDEHTKGHPLSVEVRDADGRLFTKSVNTWSCSELFPGVHFVKLDQTDSFIYDGDETFRKISGRFEYDNYGNITRTLEDGQVEPLFAGDERMTVTTFGYNLTDWILGKPSLMQSLNANGGVIAQRRFYYDGATDPAAIPSKGNLSKEEEWLNLPDTRWLGTTLSYDAYGNVKAVTDARLQRTTNDYDATETYLVRITNTLGHSRTLAYDARLGEVVSSTDQNDATTTTEYDSLGRISKVIGPTDTPTLPTISYEYQLSSTSPSRTTVHTRIQSGQPGVLTVYTFMGGLGRIIQTRSPAEDPTKQVVSGAAELDERGLTMKQWTAYLDNASTSYVSYMFIAGLSTPVAYEYDAIGRLIKRTDPDGTVSQVDYNDGETTTSAANQQTQRMVDAHGRLVQVEEVISDTKKYTTTYEYDALNNLIKVTDAHGNITGMAYDSLGRKLLMDDPDMGHWEYRYDAVDNLVSQTDARRVTISFAYDALNRLIEKSYGIPTGSGIASPGIVNYFFDEPNAQNPFTKGKLTRVADGSGSARFDYDKLGRLIKESKTIDGKTYAIQREYDLLGRLMRLTYPDSEVAAYTYNAQGGIETIALEPPAASPQAIVTDIDYNAAGQLTKIAYGNGTVTDYSYNPQTLRLDRLQTVGPLGPLQDFHYRFDALGNVTEIQDAVHTGSQVFEYDKLSRLTKATGTYGTLSYAYDAIGNITSKEGAMMTYGLADGSKPHAVTRVCPTTLNSPELQLSYDTNGNLVEKLPLDPAQSLTAQSLAYDPENRLIEVKTAPEETVTVTFQPGWNFFSLPVIPDDLRISEIFSNFTDFEQISRTVAGKDGVFEHYIGNAGFDDFSKLEYGRGYEVYCKASQPVKVTVRGKLPTKRLERPLSVGWDLLGATVLADTAAVTWLAGVDYAEIRNVSLTLVSQASPGQAYWVKIRTAGTFRPAPPRDPTNRYVYDGAGGRTKKITSDGTTIYLGEAYEILPSGERNKYVYAGGLRLTAKNSDGKLRFYHTDHLGSSNVITDGSGVLIELNEHLPYGVINRHEGSTDVAHKFTGQRLDQESGLAFYQARYYDPKLGRFIQPDPIVQDPTDPQCLNRYSYVRNNPINFVDPSGYFSFKKLLTAIGLLIVAAIAVVVGAVATVTGQEYLAAAAFGVAWTAAIASASTLISALLDSPRPRLSQKMNEISGQFIDTRTGELIPDPVTYAKAHNISTLELSFNGINTTPQHAREDALIKQHVLLVYYDPTAGLLSDLIDVGLRKFIGPTEIDKQFVRQVHNLTKAGIAIKGDAFSGGVIPPTYVSVLGGRFAPGSSFRFSSSAVSKYKSNTAIRSVEATLDFVPTDWLDEANIYQELSIKMIGGWMGLFRDIMTKFKYTEHQVSIANQ